MGTTKLAAGAAVLAVAATGLGSATPASATDGEYAINGTFSVVSNGEWARVNQRYQDEPSVRSTWVVHSTCANPISCSGKVTSSLGWTEDIYATSRMWYVKHYVPDWIPCPDGTVAPGLQIYRFTAANEDGQTVVDGSNLLLGEDETTGESGNCGRNRSLTMRLPLKITKIGD